MTWCDNLAKGNIVGYGVTVSIDYPTTFVEAYGVFFNVNVEFIKTLHYQDNVEENLYIMEGKEEDILSFIEALSK